MIALLEDSKEGGGKGVKAKSTEKNDEKAKTDEREGQVR